MLTRNPDLETLYYQVGFIIVQWGHCEQSLELLANVIFQYYGGKTFAQSNKMPRQLAAKLKFVRKCAMAVPALEPFKNELVALADDFDQFTQTRHDIVHGALSDMSPIDGVFQFIRLQSHPDTHEVMPFLYDLGAFPRVKKQLIRLGVTAPRMAKRVLEARTPK